MSGVLDGRAVVITGAGRGLGRAYALDAAREGASVVVNDVNAASASAVCEEIRSLGGVAVPSGESVATWDGAERVIATCVDEFGHLDGLVNNAGVVSMEEPTDLTEAVATGMVHVNILGSAFVGTHAIRAMQQGGGGAIVNATSSAQYGFSRMGIYGATKGALASLTYSWALDLADHGIRVNAFAPVADTNMTWMADIPVGTLPAPEANAPAVTFLLSDLAAGITGQVVQFRPPSTLEVVAHPQVTGITATFQPAEAGAVAAQFGPVLRANLQDNGWGIGRS